MAVLAIELTFPTLTAGEAAAYEPWTAASRWEQALVAKVQGFGGVVLQRSPALLLVAFGIPQTLEQLPQRAVQAALALRQLVAEGANHRPLSGAATGRALGGGAGGCAGQRSHGPAPRPRGDARLAGATIRVTRRRGRFCSRPRWGSLVEGWCEVQPREVPLQGGQPGRDRGVRGAGEPTPMGPGSGRDGGRSVRSSAGIRSSRRCASGYGRWRAAEGKWWACWVIPARASHVCATSSSVAPWRSRG